MLYRNISKRHATKLFVSYSLGSPEPMNQYTFVSRVVYPEEQLHEYQGPFYIGWYGDELLPTPVLTRKLDVFYSLINDVAFDVAMGINIREAIRRQIEFVGLEDHYIRENLSDPHGSFGILKFQILRSMIEMYELGVDEIVTEGFTVGDFLSFTRNVRRFDFSLPPYPSDP